MDSLPNKKRVIWTYVIGLFTLTAFVLMRIQAGSTPIPDTILEKFGAPYAKDIYDGAIWGVISNSFLHNDYTYFTLNFIAFLLMGFVIERTKGTWFLLFMGLSGSLVTSCTELAFSSDPGIGLTGTNFAFLTYVLIAPEIKWRSLWLRTLPWFFIGVVLFICVEQIIRHEYAVGVHSILAGIVFGSIVGLTHRFKWLFYPLQFGVISIAVVSLFYNPYSSEWNTVKGHHFHLKGDGLKAKLYYQKALQLSPNNTAARRNLEQLEIERLIDLAYDYHTKKEYGNARKIYFRILNLDHDNRWAKENLAELP